MWRRKLRMLVKKSRIFKPILIKPVRQYRVLRESIRLKLNLAKFRYHQPPANTIFIVNPEDIVWHTNYRINSEQEIRKRNFDTIRDKGKVRDGDWDKKRYKFTDLAVYKAIEDRIENQKPWAETEFFTESLAEIESGHFLWHCHNKQELLNRCGLIDQIIADIKRYGYKAGYESCLPTEDRGSLAKHKTHSDEITVNIGRDGDFLFQDGRHRLAIAKVLRIEKVPVKVLVRHQIWHDKLANNRSVEYAEMLFNHPDFKYIQKNRKL